MNARGNGAELWGAESAFEPADIEQREVEFARARSSELRQHLADHAGELEAMTRARRRDHDFGRIRKDVDDEVLVGRVREQAPGQPERRSASGNMCRIALRNTSSSAGVDSRESASGCPVSWKWL
jgi:hypothetical protein